jgi:hypothetical protein
MSPEQYAAGNIRMAQAEDVRQVAEMRHRQEAERLNKEATGLAQYGNPLSIRRDPHFEAALKELVLAHGGQM